MSREFKNNLSLEEPVNGNALRENLYKEVLSDGDVLPNPVTIKDIDKEFVKWSETDLDISYDGTKLPTYFMLSNQRFTEYMESWDNVDGERNMILNFKIITRNPNPKPGTINDHTMNIPGDKTYIMKRVKSFDKNNREYYTDYRMKQPYGIDIEYFITVVTNKLELLNEFNEKMNDKFKAITCYIRPKGHFMSMKLEDIGDESENSIDDRRYYSQEYKIIVRGYIISEDSFEIYEFPKPTVMISDDLSRKNHTEIEETVVCENENPYQYVKLKLINTVGDCVKSIKFRMDTNFKFENIEIENIRWFEVYRNGVFSFDKNSDVKDIEFMDGDEILIKKISKYKTIEVGYIIFYGHDWTKVVKDTAL